MQRYSAAGSGAGASSGGGGSARENARADSSFSSSSFNLNPRRVSQLTSYKLKCDKESLNSRLGPPDFYPQTPTCAEETLTREYLQTGYKETVDGIEEAREIVLTQTALFSKSDLIFKCKEAIKGRLRAINDSRAQKRKAGQVYGVPLSGLLLTKPGIFPEQRACSEDFRRKWTEALSQHHKRLRSLSEQVPHGYRRKSLFEVLIRYNVPLLRATWFVKVTYLNQVRPASTSLSSGAPDKPQNTRTDLWTKDVIEYLQQLLDECISKDGLFAPTPNRDRSSQTSLAGSAQYRVDSVAAISDAEEPSLQFKWWYMVRLLQWHYSEGLLLPSSIIEWVFNQLQEKISAEVLELLLPIVIDVMESIVLSQTYVRMFVDMAIRSLHDLSSGDSALIDNSSRLYLSSVLSEMLQYLILAVPESFIALDCFPLPACVVPSTNFSNVTLKVPPTIDDIDFDTRDAYLQHLSFGYAVSSLQKRACNLAKIVNPGLQGHGAAKVVQALDNSLIVGDVRLAYSSLFEDLSDAAIEERWIAEVSPCLRASLKSIGTVSLSLICSIFFLCEWATCDYRDSRTTSRQNMKLTGGKDFSQVYIAVLLLKLRMKGMLFPMQSSNDGSLIHNTGKAGSACDNFLDGTAVGNFSSHGNNIKGLVGKKNKMDIFYNPGPLHDIVVCWLDQHEIGKGGGFKRLQLLIVELIHAGIFYPQAYVRQLIVSGIMDKNETSVDLEKQNRHNRILKQLPGPYLFDVLEEARIAEVPLLYDIVSVYSNERRLLLDGYFSGHSDHINTITDTYLSSTVHKQKDHPGAFKDCASPTLLDCHRNGNVALNHMSSKRDKMKPQFAVLKVTISNMLHFPQPFSILIETRTNESQGNLKRPLGSIGIKTNLIEGTPGCEECRRAKRQKLSHETSSSPQMFSSDHSDEEDTWWVRKGPKSQESIKVEPPLRSTKHASRGRQKIVRKTQSLSQLASARIESSQGVSTSHTCDNKVKCPHHRTGVEGEIPKDIDRSSHLSEIGKSLRQLRLLEKRSISIWLLKSIKRLIEGNGKAASNVINCTGGLSLQSDERNPVRWKLGEDELSAILYILDMSSDLISAVRFLLWLLPKILGGPSTTVHAGRNIILQSRNRENQVCQVGEAYLLSSLRRYESVLRAADLLPEALTGAMRRTVANGRTSGSLTLGYARNLLNKYRDVPSVTKWEKDFRASCDQKLLAELDAVRSLDGDFGFSSGVPAGVEDFDEYFRQKMSGRISRIGTMKELVHKQVDEAVKYFYGKERKHSEPNSTKIPTEKLDDGYQIAHEIVMSLVDCIRQNGSSTQDGDPFIVASAVSAIVCNVGPAVAKLLDFATSSNSLKFSSTTSSMNCVQQILHIHVTCLCLLKEAIGERLSRIFEIALAAEASSVISASSSPAKAHRSYFHSSPESHDINLNHSSDILNNSAKVSIGKATKSAAAVSALIIGSIVHGVTTLERMVTVLKLKEGLDVLQYIRNVRSSSNGVSRPFGASKADPSVEIYVHWFRVLIGNCRTISDGLITEILGESYILALSRMQRMLPLNLVLPPAYSMFGMIIWRPYTFGSNVTGREDIQLYQCLSSAIGDAIRHQPFRDLCLRNSHAFYDLLVNDVGDSEFAAMLELLGPDKRLKTMAFVPLRARLFLNAIIDCKMPQFTMTHEEGSRITGPNDHRVYGESEAKLPDQLVHVLDSLQPAKFQWQWVELRLLLHEQALIEKTETQNMSFADAIRSLSPNAENFALSEKERNLTEILLTRILVRPDAAPLYSEVVHLLGKSLEESLVMDIKWILAGSDVLLGRKSIRQQLLYFAQRQGLSTRIQFWKPWGWSCPIADAVTTGVGKRKLEAVSIEEGEVVDECVGIKKSGKSKLHLLDGEVTFSGQQYQTEKALAELLLPCIDRSSSELRSVFAAELIKQMSTIDQHINTFTRGGSKQMGISPGIEGSSSKASSRKGMRGGSPGLGRRPTGTSDSMRPSAAALKASMWLRLQFILRLLPVIYADREPSARNMRSMLASIILRLLGTRVVYEDADLSLFTTQAISPKREVGPLLDTTTSSTDSSGESLFDTFLCVLHGLLSNCKPNWMKPSASKSTVKSRDFSVFDREVAESLQADLDRMELPATVRRRIQAAMPVLPPSLPFPISCHPPTLSSAALAPLSTSAPGPHPRILPCSRTSTNISSRSRTPPLQDLDMEIDPWTLLEDGTSFASASSSNMGGVSSDHSNLKASSWLKGAVRVRRKDLMYIGALDDDS